MHCLNSLFQSFALHTPHRPTSLLVFAPHSCDADLARVVHGDSKSNRHTSVLKLGDPSGGLNIPSGNVHFLAASETPCVSGILNPSLTATPCSHLSSLPPFKQKLRTRRFHRHPSDSGAADWWTTLGNKLPHRMLSPGLFPDSTQTPLALTTVESHNSRRTLPRAPPTASQHLHGASGQTYPKLTPYLLSTSFPSRLCQAIR